MLSDDDDRHLLAHSCRYVTLLIWNWWYLDVVSRDEAEQFLKKMQMKEILMPIMTEQIWDHDIYIYKKNWKKMLTSKSI